MYDRTNPNKKPNKESNFPRPEYLTVLLIPLLINKIIKIIITNNYVNPSNCRLTTVRRIINELFYRHCYQHK